MNYWLAKTEPNTYSWQDLINEPDKRTMWEGIRNYRVRNMIRDEIKLGDFVFIYHSVVKPMAIHGIAKIVKECYPDNCAFDPQHHYFDPKSKPENPAWMMFDVEAVESFERPVTLEEIKTHAPLENMGLIKKGNRLSIQEVTKAEWDYVKSLTKLIPVT